MIKKTSKDYSQNKTLDTTDDDALTTSSSVRNSDYLAFDIQENLTKGMLEEFREDFHSKQGTDFKWLLRSCIEEALSFFLEWVPSSIILFFLTKSYSQDIVTGFGYGLVWLNCIGQGLFYGLGSGLETMASHAHGAKNYEQVGILFQKTLFIFSLMFLPISILMIYSENILYLWNDNYELCLIAGQFCRCCIPGIAFLSIYYAYKAILNAQNEYRLQVYSSGINFFLTILYCLILISWLDFGIIGAATVFSLSQFSNLVLCYNFAKRRENLKKCFIPFNKKCFQDLKPFLYTAIPIGSLVSLEWILQEINSIIASNLPEEQYSANIVIANLASTCVQLPLGYATAACTFIGNEMGRGNVQNAKKYALYSSYILIVHLIVTGIPIILLRESISSTFGVNENVQQNIVKIIFFAFGVYCLDSIQCLVTAFMRAIAKEKYSSVSFLVSYALFGLTSSYYLAFHTSLEIKGIWLGIMIGMSIYLILQFVMIKITDINQMAEVISDRMSISDISEKQSIKQMDIHDT